MKRAVEEAHVHAQVLLEGLRSDVADETLAHHSMKHPLHVAADQRAERGDTSEDNASPS